MSTDHSQEVWVCQECESSGSTELPEFRSAGVYHEHLRASHPALSSLETDLIVQFGVQQRPLLLFGCTFCDWQLPLPHDPAQLDDNQRSLYRHIGDEHLRSWALISFPWNEDSQLLASSGWSTASTEESSTSEDGRRQLLSEVDPNPVDAIRKHL